MRLKIMCAVEQAGGKGETEKGKQPAAQKKRTHTTRQATQTQPAVSLTADVFTATLEIIPAGLVQDLGGWQDEHVEKDL